MDNNFFYFMKHYLLAFAILVLMASCKKETLPNSTTNTPVFMFEGSINNDSVTYTAGKNELYMFTDFYQDNQKLMTLKGYFAPYNCITCEPYLSFEFKDMHDNIEKTMYQNIYTFFENIHFYSSSFDSIALNIPNETFRFSPDNNPPGTTYLWKFGDGDTSTLMAPIHTFKNGGVSNVTLITSYNSLVDSISIPINVDLFSGCRTKFHTNILANNEVEIDAEGVFNSFLWTLGDGNFQSGKSISHTYNSNNIFEITLQTDGVGCEAFYKRKVNLSGNNNIPVANFYYSNSITSELKTLPRLNNSSCIITYKKDNKTYVSYKQNTVENQTNREVFEMTKFQLYENNLQDKKTLLINGKVNTFLYNIDNNNDSISIKSNKLSIAVAYPTQ